MLEWFIDLAYAFKNCPDFFYLFLGLWFAFFLYYEAYLYEKKEHLKEKAENYEKLRDFIDFIYNDESSLRSDVIEYLHRKKYEDECSEAEKKLDDFMNIF